ncbi:Protein CBG28109 [Caenorhabditis briggsae]|uniref:Protein CBG28109 n=1 Tax=Caenorhabditis briggsae TaxID=6238 RepID=B6IGU8_CAEBR|nr:Protein CBG28109 [Caenorhabditis briggsae]CAR99128.1 Protein CBG28109 [Caenorhabditis briggsae]
MLPGNSANLVEETARLTMSLKNMELELEKYKNYISNMNWEKEDSRKKDSNESKRLLMMETSNLGEKNAELNRELVEAKLSVKKLNNELESAQEIVMLNKKDYNKVWDDMMFYKNKVDFPSNNQNLEHHVQTLERQLREEMEAKNALLEENKRLKGVFDPDACMICYVPLPISRLHQALV